MGYIKAGKSPITYFQLATKLWHPKLPNRESLSSTSSQNDNKMVKYEARDGRWKIFLFKHFPNDSRMVIPSVRWNSLKDEIEILVLQIAFWLMINSPGNLAKRCSGGNISSSKRKNISKKRGKYFLLKKGWWLFCWSVQCGVGGLHTVEPPPASNSQLAAHRRLITCKYC